MADGQSSLNPTILGRPLFPSMDWIKRSVSKISSAIQNAQGEPMMADSGSLNLSAFPVFPKMGPLIRTDYGRAPSERPDFLDPSQQWDARRPTKTAGSAPQPVAPTFLSPEQQGFYNYSRLSPQSQNVVSAVSQPAPAFSSGLPSVAQQFPFEPYRQPMAPVNVGLGGMTERVGVRTAYGMVYPTKGQEAAAQRLAQMPAMGARLAEAGKEVVRPQMVSSALSGIEAGQGPASLEGLTQAEKIQAMRARGRQLALEMAQKQRDDTSKMLAQRKEDARRNILEIIESRNLAEQKALTESTPAVPTTRKMTKAEERRAAKEAKQEAAKNNFVGFNPSGNPIIKIPDGRGGYVVPNEEGGYTPYG